MLPPTRSQGRSGLDEMRTIIERAVPMEPMRRTMRTSRLAENPHAALAPQPVDDAGRDGERWDQDLTISDSHPTLAHDGPPSGGSLATASGGTFPQRMDAHTAAASAAGPPAHQLRDNDLPQARQVPLTSHAPAAPARVGAKNRVCDGVAGTRVVPLI